MRGGFARYKIVVSAVRIVSQHNTWPTHGEDFDTILRIPPLNTLGRGEPPADVTSRS